MIRAVDDRFQSSSTWYSINGNDVLLLCNGCTHPFFFLFCFSSVHTKSIASECKTIIVAFIVDQIHRNFQSFVCANDKIITFSICFYVLKHVYRHYQHRIKRTKLRRRTQKKRINVRNSKYAAYSLRKINEHLVVSFIHRYNQTHDMIEMNSK